ncbi:MAG: hypothetical protein RKR03_07090 [Candidatus Competibacter sp.]|nr:hypothetical protein [Candidatus Competibacter sp.]
MSERMSLGQVGLLVLYAIGMTIGQILFKLTAPLLAGDLPIMERLVLLATSKEFIIALVLYGALTVLWVWILSFTPLSRAYPFAALAFLLTPIVGAAVFGEPLTSRFVAGLAAILVGLWLITG